MLGNHKTDGGGGTATNMFKDRKFGFVTFDQMHDPTAKERVEGEKDHEPREVSLTSSVVNTIFSTEEK